MAKVAVFGSMADSLINFRGPLLEAIVAGGHEVHALSPPADPWVVERLVRMGVRHHVVPLARTGLNPLRDLETLLSLYNLYRRIRPDYLLAYTIKPVIYGCLSAYLAGVPQRYAMITGLGYAFAGRGAVSRLIGKAAQVLYRLALTGANRVFFQNPDNLRIFLDLNLIRGPDQAVLINGSGVDLDHYHPVPLPTEPSFLMIARLLRDKGVYEYVDAARRVKALHPGVRFCLAGWIDDNPTAISPMELDGWVAQGVVDYLGRLEDVRPAIAASSVYVLPSYHEGIPRTVLEAMAMARPVITTDVPGCRETVREGENGFLVPARDADALAAAMLRFVEAPERMRAMGEASRRLAQQRFDVHRVNAVILKTMGLME